MPTTIADLWFLTFEGRVLDIRAPLFNSRQIEGEVRRANAERRAGRADWTAIDLEEVILTFVRRAADVASYGAPKQTGEPPKRSEQIHLRAVPSPGELPAGKGGRW